MKVALVDDDEKQIEYLSKLISEELYHLGDRAFRIYKYRSGEEFLSQWETGKFDIVILDIYMSGLTGIEIAYKIREQDEHVVLAFCTSSNEYASESYDVGAKHYIRKPVTPDSISKMFRRLNIDIIEKTRIIKLPDGHNIVLRNILYTEYENHVITIYFNDKQTYRIRTSQTELESLLMPNGYFCSPYKGITVNFYAIKEMTDSEIILIDDSILPLTRRKTKEVKEAYKKFKFEQMRKEVGA